MEAGATVWEAAYEMMRRMGMTTMFGNPGSTEQPMLKNFPSDFRYILGLQEASVVAMADGFSQATGKPAVVSLHSCVGTGNGMGNIASAFLNKTPLIIIAGQQTREMLIGEPMLTNHDPLQLPKPYVKWAYQPSRAEDVPAALMRAIAMATQAPQGPVYLSVPLDDWDHVMEQKTVLRSIAHRYGPDPELIRTFADRISKAKRPAIVYGPEVDRAGAWDLGIEYAEKLDVPVFQAPLSERMPFPEDHPLYRGMLPIARGPLSAAIEGFDLVLVVGAQVWRYYPFIDGPIIPEGVEILQITNDPNDAALALVGDSLVSDAKLALESLLSAAVDKGKKQFIRKTPVKYDYALSAKKTGPMLAKDVFEALADLRPTNAIIMQESPSNRTPLAAAWPVLRTGGFYTMASGGLGWNSPAAVGVALAQSQLGTNDPVILIIGDGSFQYSVQSLYTAVREKSKIVYLVPLNEEYAILKAFAVLEKTPNVPGLDLPNLNIAATAEAFGMNTVRATTIDAVRKAFSEALVADGPTCIEFPIVQGGSVA
jgi:benzoylformate decarboxylase